MPSSSEVSSSSEELLPYEAPSSSESFSIGRQNISIYFRGRLLIAASPLLKGLKKPGRSAQGKELPVEGMELRVIELRQNFYKQVY
ncbi:hypothetical protein CVT25_002654 [Psilocybe cyanescens]|uniref:Uncharacterized protein n=1 Tax=Psilocybe cyanescens TaxID=93625 RepID=A0A409WLI5_PSICY|nr:hypothetical protein CVT25_002654 [Psilocybe cyanescens]